MALCGLGKSAPLPVISTLKRFRDEYVEHIVDKKCRAKVCTALRQFHINPEFCIGCGKCVKVCPFEAITLENNLAYIDPAKCKSCRKCETECPQNAIVAVNFPPRKAKPADAAPVAQAASAASKAAQPVAEPKKETVEVKAAEAPKEAPKTEA